MVDARSGERIMPDRERAEMEAAARAEAERQAQFEAAARIEAEAQAQALQAEVARLREKSARYGEM